MQTLEVQCQYSHVQALSCTLMIQSFIYNNTAYNGGHIAVILVSHACANVTITINNSLFEDKNATAW